MAMFHSYVSSVQNLSYTGSIVPYKKKTSTNGGLAATAHLSLLEAIPIQPTAGKLSDSTYSTNLN